MTHILTYMYIYIYLKSFYKVPNLVQYLDILKILQIALMQINANIFDQERGRKYKRN